MSMVHIVIKLTTVLSVLIGRFIIINTYISNNFYYTETAYFQQLQRFQCWQEILGIVSFVISLLKLGKF